MKCNYCGKEEVLPFKCQFCGGLFCAEHRLPESHNCSQIGKAKAPKEEPPPFDYKVTYAPQRSARKLGFSQTEIKHLAIGALLVSGVGLSMWAPSLESIITMSVVLVVILFTLSFLLHEIAHKLVAQRYGMWAEFRIVLFGALLTLLSIIIPFKFIAPGAVMIAGAADKKTVGKTSIAGPLTNIVLCAISFALTFAIAETSSFFLVALYTSSFNAFIAVINLIPAGILDGWKIFDWNKAVWISAFALSVALLISIFGLYWRFFGLF